MTSFEKQFEDKKWFILTAILVIFFALKIIESFYRPFSFDELFTWHIAQIPTLKGLWEAMGPMDPSPPLYYIVTRISQSVFGYGEFGTRLPALISILVAMSFLFLILDKRCGAITAITGVLLLGLTPASSLTCNARTYTFIIALCTISLWCWQNVAAHTRRVLSLLGLFLSLSMALYSHYYAFLLFIPIVVGELYRSLQIKRIDWPVWITLMLAAATIIPLIPLAERCASLSRWFWSKPNSATFFQCNLLYAAPAIAVLMAAVIFMCFKKTDNEQLLEIKIPIKQPPAEYEVAAAIGLAIIPFGGFLIALFFTNAFVTRYFVSAAVGAVILAAYARNLIKRSCVLEGTLLMIITFLLFLCFQGYLILSAMEINRDLKSRMNILSNTGDDLPVVMLSHNHFMVTQHYAPEPLKKRLFYLIDYDLCFKYKKKASDISIDGLSRLAPIKVEDLITFLNTHKVFYIAGNKSSYMSRLKTMVTPYDPVASLDKEREPAKYLLKVSANK
jgi:4-amino-4-deoxy-L-arabinose transferase-like glycosyltransferase